MARPIASTRSRVGAEHGCAERRNPVDHPVQGARDPVAPRRGQKLLERGGAGSACLLPGLLGGQHAGGLRGRRVRQEHKLTAESSSGSAEPTRTLSGSRWVPESQRTMIGPFSVHTARLVVWPV